MLLSAFVSCGPLTLGLGAHMHGLYVHTIFPQLYEKKVTSHTTYPLEVDNSTVFSVFQVASPHLCVSCVRVKARRPTILHA